MTFNSTKTEQFELYKDLFEKENGNIDLQNEEERKKLSVFIIEKRKEIQSILKAEGGVQFKELDENGNSKTKWFDLIAEQRELLGLPKKITYEVYNIYIQLIKTHNENINFDEFLKMFKNSELKKAKGEVSDNMENLMNNGGGSELHSVSEVISNAIDATNPENVVGRFGKGFFQIGRFLNAKDTKVIVTSKKEDSKAFQIILENEFNKTKNLKESKELFVASSISDKEEIGTIVEVQKRLSGSEQKKLKEYINSKFKTNKSVNLKVNGNIINHLDEYVYVNGNKLKKATKNVEIEITDNGIKIIDNGIGMNSDDLSTKLLFPNDTSKARKEPKESKLKQIVEKEVSFFYKVGELKEEIINNEKKKDKTNISLMIGGVIIESFETETSNNIQEFVLELPSFTYLMENKSDISLTKEVIVSLQIILEKIHNKIEDKQEKVAILEVLGNIVQYLKARPTEASNSGKYNIDKILKNNFTRLKEDLEQDGTKVVAGDKKIIEAIGSKDEILYVSQDFEKVDIQNIPGVKKLENIENSKVPFYAIDFDENCDFSYIITKKGILVDYKYLDKPETIEILNVLVNLNISYELEEERVNYGRIVDGKVLEEGINDLISEDNNTKEDKKIEVKNSFINSETERENFYDKISDFFYEFIEANNIINEKFTFLTDDSFYINNDINSFLDKSGDITDDIAFFCTSKFSLDESKQYKNKNIFLEFYKNASEKNINTITLFQEYIKTLDNKWEYLDTVLKLLTNDSSDNSNISLILNKLGNDKNIIQKIDLLNKLDSQNIDNYDLEEIYNIDYNIYLGVMEKKVGESIDGSGPLHKIQGGFYVIVKLKNGKEGIYLEKEGKGNFYNGYEGKEFNNIKSIIEVGNGIIGLNKESFFEINSNETKYLKSESIEQLIKIDSGFARLINLGNLKQLIIERNGKKEVYNNEICGININNISHLTALNGGILINSNMYDCNLILNYISFGDNPNINYNNFINSYSEEDDFFDEPSFGKIEGGFLLHFYKSGGNGARGLLTVINGKPNIVKKIDGNNIISFSKVGCVNNGIEGVVELSNGNEYIFSIINGEEKIYKECNGSEIISIDDFSELNNGINGGKITLENNLSYNFLILNGKINIIDNIYRYTSYLDIKDHIGLSSYNFLDFLLKGGEFLNNEEIEGGFGDLDNNFKLSELLYLNNLESEKLTDIFYLESENVSKLSNFLIKFKSKILNILNILNSDNLGYIEDSISKLNNLFLDIQKEELNLSIYNRKILSQIDGQDKSSQLWIRETIQNSIDAVRKTGEKDKNINVDFFENEGSFVASFEDSVGMTSEEVFKYLLPIGKSGKLSGEGIGKFGQGFFSLFIGAKEVNLKTSIGDGKTTYLNIKPVTNKDNLIEDFNIYYEVKDEEFKGTKIERVDDSEGVEANLSAMFGINNIEKYTGCTEGIHINYNSELITGKNEELLVEKVSDLGELKLLKNGGFERITKDGLYMSEIKDIYLDIFPDWIVEIIKKEQLTIDIPSGIDLVSSRSEFANSKDLEKLKPYIFNIITKYIVKLTLDGKIKVPMMPEDYMGDDQRERKISKFSEIMYLVNDINKGGTIKNIKNTEIFKDKSNMALFLIMLEIEKGGEKVSIQLLKKRREDEEYLNSNVLGRMKSVVEKGKRYANDKINDNIIIIEETDELSKFKNDLIKEFGELFNIILGKKIEIGFYKDNTSLAHAKGDNLIRFNINFIDKFINNKEKIIEIMTHELTHLKEGSNKWGSHEKDLEHEYSFEKIQREILEMYLQLKKG